MHPIAAKNKYIGILMMKMSKEYFALGRKGISEVSAGHVKDLTKYSKNLTHVVTIGTDGRYDQVTLIEGDTLEDIYNATADFKLGKKASYIDIVDCVVGIKAPPRGQAGKG